MTYLSWLTDLIPSWFWLVFLISGILGLILSQIFSKFPYAFTIRLTSLALVIVSIWFLGTTANEEKWQKRVQELENRLAVAEAESKCVTNQVQDKVVEQIRYIRGNTEYIVQYIDRDIVKKEEVIKYIEQCPIPKDIVDAHNAAASLTKENTK